jgi:hypothetical protein
MQKTIFVTVSDDRFGRKNGLYSATQDKIFTIFKKNHGYGITDFLFLKWNDLCETDFYRENKKMLDHTNPDMNGRSYKPFAILEGLKRIGDGDFLIYNDVSPEIWSMDENYGIDPSLYDIKVIQDLCVKNGGILTADVTWVVNGEFGDHTHEHFTLERCIKKMGLENYRHSLQHASGMMVIQKRKKTVDFAEEWLYWNTIDECASLGPITDNGESTHSYWNEEGAHKIGHRHDQSISGLLINKMGNNLVRNCGTYDFLSYSMKDREYRFIPSNVDRGQFTWRNHFDGSNWICKKIER